MNDRKVVSRTTAPTFTPATAPVLDPVVNTLPEGFPGRTVLEGAGLNTLDKVKLVFGDSGLNGETIAKIQLALRAK